MFPRDTDQQREWIYNEQVRTNELLEQLISLNKPHEEPKPTVVKPENKPAKRNYQRRQAR